MRGAGIKPDHMPGDDRPILLDVSRILRRQNRRHTGIDRVEAAWLNYVITHPAAVFGLARTRLGYQLFDRGDLANLACGPANQPWSPPWRLAQLLRQLPSDAIYLNLGHSNLTPRVVNALISRGLSPKVAMVHDTIPLDDPDLQRPESKQKFRQFLDQAARMDWLICPSQHSADRLREHVPNAPKCLVVPLGTTEFPPPAPIDVPGPFVLVVGTVEPRKNIQFLLNLWGQYAHEDAWPNLLICGAAGWEKPAVLKALTAGPAKVTWVQSASDAQIAWAYDTARALVFPSKSEGYALPPREALARGCPVIASKLSVLAADFPDQIHFADLTDPEVWAQAIRSDFPRRAPVSGPDWTGHFKTVLNSV